MIYEVTFRHIAIREVDEVTCCIKWRDTIEVLHIIGMAACILKGLIKVLHIIGTATCILEGLICSFLCGMGTQDVSLECSNLM